MSNSYSALLRNRAYLKAWLAQGVSQLGDSVARIALMLAITENSASPLALSAVVFLQAAPALLIGPLAGVYVDRLNKRVLMVITDALRGIAVLTLFFAAPTWMILAVSALLAVLGSFFAPARSAFLAEVVNHKELLTANSLNESTTTVVNLLGPGLAGIMVATKGVGLAFLFDALTFFFSCFMLLCIKYTPAAQSAGSKKLGRALTDGVAAIRADATLTYVIVLFTCSSFLLGGVNVLLVDYLRNKLAVTPQQFGLVYTLIFAGALPTTLLLGHFGGRWDKRRILSLGALALGFSMFGFVVRPGFYPVLLWAVVLGASDGLMGIPASTLMMENAPPELRGRVMSVFSTCVRVGGLTGLGLSGAAAMVVPTHLLISLSGVGLVSLVFLVLPVVERGLTRTQHSPTVKAV